MNSQNTTDTESYLIFLQQYIENPGLIALLFVLLWISYLIYKDKLHIIYKILPFNKEKKKHTKLNDLLKHPIFKDLEFWADYRVSQIYDIENYNTNDEAKLLIARDLLTVKFKVAKNEIYNSLKSFLDNSNTTTNLNDIIRRVLDNVKSSQYSEFKKMKIPQLFIEKWFEVCRIRDTYLNRALNEIIMTKLVWSDYDKIYIILDNLHVYYSAILSDMLKTIESINGDLKGQIYKGIVIGGNEYKKYPIPDKNYVPIVESRLRELLLLTKADKAAINIFHDINGDDYINCLTSRIYFCSLTDKTNLFDKIQYTTCTFLDAAISEFKQHLPSFNNIDKYNVIMQRYLKQANCEGVIMVPIFNNSKLKGFLSLGYESEELFNKIDTKYVIDTTMKYSAIINIYVDYTKTGLKYN